jgi:prepilin signal peptidase PulO-like enzyme (type II secretory pathway)
MHDLMKDIDLLISPPSAKNQLLITNLTGHPALSIPIGLDSLNHPVSMTIIGHLSVVGAIVGFVIFWALYQLANLLYGSDRIPLGMGDVKLAMMMGAMLGFHRIFFALFWGIVLGGVITILLLLSRRVSRNTALPYGQYLAISGIAFLIWGADYVQQYLN